MYSNPHVTFSYPAEYRTNAGFHLGLYHRTTPKTTLVERGPKTTLENMNMRAISNPGPKTMAKLPRMVDTKSHTAL